MMSCSLPLFGEIVDIHNVTSYLLLSEDEDNAEPPADNENDAAEEDSWEWKEQDCQDASTPGFEKCSLAQCLVSISPTEELVAVSNRNKATFLTRKWLTQSPAQPRLCYEITWNGLLTPNSESVTSVLCLPLASQQRSSQGAPDWTCVIAGFSSGYLRIYMQNGAQLIQQLLHDSEVIEVKMRTKQPLVPSTAWEQVDELLILYSNAVVTIDGFSLYQSLKACRNQLAKSSASSMTELIDPPPLAYRKWRIKDHKSLVTASNVGLITPSLFDRMQKASVLQNFNSTVKQSVPAYNHIITCGLEPFIGVYEALEGSSPALMSDVALAVASKLKSAMYSKLTAASGWFGFSARQQTEHTGDSKSDVKVEKGTPLPIRFGLPDQRRQALSIQLSPVRNLAAITDNLGRVLLFDVERGIVVRMWKGYRDASCGWLVVNESPGDESSSHPGIGAGQSTDTLSAALFLVIYAPRRGILEIWLTEQGGRVGAFNVGKNCRLIYPGYCTLGNIFPKDYFKHSGMSPNQCYLIEEDGIIKTIHVPFHCALSNIKSISLKDAQLLRSLACVLDKVCGGKVDEKTSLKSIKALFADIQIFDNQIEGIKRIVTCNHLDSVTLQLYLEEIIATILQNDSGDGANGSEEDIEFEARKEQVAECCKAHITIIKFYDVLCKLKDEGSGPDFDPCGSCSQEQALAANLNLTESEAVSFSSSVEQFQKAWHIHNVDRISPDIATTNLSVTAFVNCFENVIVSNEGDEKERAASCTNTQVKVFLRKDLAKAQRDSLGSFLFQDAIIGHISISQVIFHLGNLAILPEEIMGLLISYALSENGRCLVRLENCLFLHSMVRSICFMTGGPEGHYLSLLPGAASSWWDPVRRVLLQCRAIGQSLVTAVICRGVAIDLLRSSKKVKEEDESDVDQNDWIAITMDAEAWNLLINQLEDLLALYCFVHSNHCLDQPCPQSNNYDNQLKTSGSCCSLLSNSDSACETKLQKSVSRSTSFSIEDVLTGGYDHVAQIAASCLVRQQVPGPCLGQPRRRTTRQNDESALVDDEETDSDILEGLNSLRIRFPFSLNHDMLWINCAWECVMLWSDNFEDIAMLSSSLVHLSCIHASSLKEGLAVIIWKAVYKDTIKSVAALVEKVGKAPKERLCRKVTNMGYRSLERFLGTCQRLLEIILENEIDDEIEEKPGVTLETNWEDMEIQKSCLIEQAWAEPLTNRAVVRHYWCCVMALRLVFVSSLKGFKFLMLFDAKGKHALSQALASRMSFSVELEEAVLAARTKFCCEVLTSLVREETPSQDQLNESMLIANKMALSHLVFLLAPHFGVDDDALRLHYSAQLYLAGFDIEATEAAHMVANKTELASQLTAVAGCRLAYSLLHSKEQHVLSRVLTSMPTHVTAWLQEQDIGQLCSTSFPMDSTLKLLQTALSASSDGSSKRKFIAELIECLQTLT